MSEQKKIISRLVTQCFLLNECVCNGEPVPSKNLTDKNLCSNYWNNELDKLTEKLQKMVNEVYGTGWEVVYTGLRPCIAKDGVYKEL